MAQPRPSTEVIKVNETQRDMGDILTEKLQFKMITIKVFADEIVEFQYKSGTKISKKLCKLIEQLSKALQNEIYVNSGNEDLLEWTCSGKVLQINDVHKLAKTYFSTTWKLLRNILEQHGFGSKLVKLGPRKKANSYSIYHKKAWFTRDDKESWKKIVDCSGFTKSDVLSIVEWKTLKLEATNKELELKIKKLSKTV